MKYARIVEGRIVDVVDPSVYSPRPDWGQTDEDLLNRIFEAVGGFAAFKEIPDHIENGAFDNGDDTYENVTERTDKVYAEAALAAAQLDDLKP